MPLFRAKPSAARGRTMKALSLRQPWAAAVLHLGKVVENRRWNTRFRGEFLIHAAKAMTRAELEDAFEFCEDVLGVARTFEIGEAFKDLPLGAIVGRARLVDVVPPRPEYMPEGLEQHYPEALRAGGWRWHMREQYGFVLADVRATPLVACRGALGFFEVPADVVSQLSQLEEHT